MFDFEENSLGKLLKRKNDDYDLQLGLAISKSIKKTPGSQILTPQEIHLKIQQKVKFYLNSSSDQNM